MENKETNYLVKQNTNGVVMTSSRRIAEVFGKEHKNVLRSIEENLKYFTKLNFELSKYTDSKGKLVKIKSKNDHSTKYCKDCADKIFNEQCKINMRKYREK